MSTLLAKLASREVLSYAAFRRLREYISKKYASRTPTFRAGIFADAVNRIVGDKIPKLPEDRMNLFRAYLYGSTLKKGVFSINRSDVFKSSLRLKLSDDPFITEMKRWLEETLQATVSREKISAYILDVCRMKVEYPDVDIPDMHIEEIADSFDEAAKGTADSLDGNAADSTEGGSLTLYGSGYEGDENWVTIKRREKGDRINDLSQTVGRDRKAVAVSLATVVVLLCSFLFAVYVNAVGNMKKTVCNTIINAELLPAGRWGKRQEQPNNLENDQEDGCDQEPIRMRATAYDLSYESCGKDRSHPEYGITRSGTRAEAGRTIAVDPEVIPLGSIVEITFPEEYSHMDGTYIAEDTGSLIKENRIDIFFGEDEEGSKEINRKALQFGVQYVDVVVIGPDQEKR